MSSNLVLGHVADPEDELKGFGYYIPGDPGAVAAVSGRFEQIANTTTQIASIIDGIESQKVWQGSASRAFADKVKALPDKLSATTKSFRDAADAVTDYAGALRRAIESADRAREMQNEANQDSQQWVKYCRTIFTYNLSQADAAAHGAHVEFQSYPPDPGVDGRRAAQDLIEQARRDLAEAARTLDARLRSAREAAPHKPSGFSHFLSGALHAVEGVGKGFLDGTASLLTLAQTFSPFPIGVDFTKLLKGQNPIFNTYSRRFEMADAIGKGLATDPGGTLKAMGKSIVDWDDWAHDPAHAIGELIPNIGLAVATGGGGEAAAAGERLGEAGGSAAQRLASKAGKALGDLADGANPASALTHAGLKVLRDEHPGDLEQALSAKDLAELQNRAGEGAEEANREREEREREDSEGGR